MIRLHALHYPVTVLGHGRRVGIWFQGCSIGCAGCMSTETWARERGREVPVESVIDWCRTTTGGTCDGITISGGEPFEQSTGLEDLLVGLQEWRSAIDYPVDILCYSGFPLRHLMEKHPGILARLDALVPEPFEESLAPAYLRGSSNQSIVALSDLGKLRYPADRAAQPPEKRLQVATDGGRVWLIGVPGRGDLKRMEKLWRDRGIEPSW